MAHEKKILSLIVVLVVLSITQVSSVRPKDFINSFRKNLRHEQLSHNGSHSNIRGSNFFFHEITSGTCVSNGMESITSSELCVLAANTHGFYFDQPAHGIDDGLNDRFEGCYVQPWLNLPSFTPEFIKTSNSLLIFNRGDDCRAENLECQCTQINPCFCRTRYFIVGNQAKMKRRGAALSGQFEVTWNLDLGPQENLLESAFLKAAFEQSLKDYINNDILCSDNIQFKGAEFFSVEIPFSSDDTGKRRAVSGNGKCKGDVSKCKKPVKGKKAKFFEADPSRVVKATHRADEFCEVFLNSTIFDAFSERLLTASAFNYNVDVDVIAELEGNLKLDYQVSFSPEKGDGLDQVEEVDMDPNVPQEVNPICTEAHCSTQNADMMKIFDYFDIPIEPDKHECLYQGINCDDQDLVTHIWMVNYGFSGKTIPETFNELKSLTGLFLGGNELIGTIPSRLATLRRLKVLWLENNALTGTIPTQLGNLRGLHELNLHENNLSGNIPTDFARLNNLRLLNLGKNNLEGSIPNLCQEPPTDKPEEPIDDCGPFSKSLDLKKIGSMWFDKTRLTKKAPLIHLESLSLFENNLSGSIPSGISGCSFLADLNIAENNLSGEIPDELGDLTNLKVLDIYNNTFAGSIPTTIGNLHQMKKFNMYGNYLSNTIPTEMGLLSSIDELVFDENLLTGPIPSHLGSLIKLKYLTFGGNVMSGEIPTELGHLVSLINLDLRGYEVVTTVKGKRSAGTMPSELGNLKNWKYVVFEDNGVQGALPSEFGDLQASETMWMKNQALTGAFPSELGQLGSISTISFGNNAMEGTIPSSLGGAAGLSNLDIGGTVLSGEIPTELGSLSSLEFVSLDNCQVDGSLPTELGNIENLVTFSAKGTKLSGSIPTEIALLTGLKSLQFGKEVFVCYVLLFLLCICKTMHLLNFFQDRQKETK